MVEGKEKGRSNKFEGVKIEEMKNRNRVQATKLE
jgi:hypothetical protein